MDREQVLGALIDAGKKLNPAYLVKNPVIFVTEISTIIVIVLTIVPGFFGGTQGRWYYSAISVVLLFTVIFATFAESLAETQGEAHAESLRAMKEEVIGKRLEEDAPLEEIDEANLEEVESDKLEKGDVVFVEEGDMIPRDGSIIEGSASIDESAITGESEPVIRQSGGDKSSVTGGTEVLSDQLKIEITAAAGESFMDEMIGLVESASREKTPNEISLTLLLASFTFIYMLVVTTLTFFGDFVRLNVEVADQIALLIGLIPTTVGALLSAIRIAGMTRVTRDNVIAKSGKAVESAGDLDVLILDKTGTITTGERAAADFIPLGGGDRLEVAEAALKSSFYDETTEGRSVVALAEQEGIEVDKGELPEEGFIEFSAETGMSGIDLDDGTEIRKGSVDEIRDYASSIPDELDDKAAEVADSGGTPLGLAVNEKVIGIIELQDELKTGIGDRIARLQKMGIKTIMCTGDNERTARYIAEEAGLDEYYAEFQPEEKIGLVEDEKAKGHMVGMTGDGTNDAPALAKADVGLAMNAGTAAAKEAGNMVDMDSDPTKLIEVVGIGKQLLMTRGSLTTFSIANDISRYFALVPAIFSASIPALGKMNLMNLHSLQSVVISSLIYNSLIIPFLVPLAMRGVEYKPVSASRLLVRNMLIYGGSGLVVPFLSIKLIDWLLVTVGVF
ncbi:MAG: potassium-transporting ATPase subunit KdpB [Candidatus Bipolaricaulota bacterium]|nr:potassium-transporting ATPase subunit KdpB [Candidatus Bipolaricaulota bacterium]MBS3792696.1 potassium-transporting ATPase subunit KdpB [Candidatus Bipolaricaulota bacterium]